MQWFATNLTPYSDGIIASASYPLKTSVLEGVYNRIKINKPMSHGYRDID